MKIKEIAKILDGEAFGDGSIEINSIASLETAKSGEIAFKDSSTLIENIKSISASCLIVTNNFNQELPFSLIKVKNPKLAFAKIAEILHPPKRHKPQTHKSSVISETAQIGTDVFIGAFCCVGENSIIGNGTHLRAGSKVGDNVKIGNNCVLDPNVFVDDNCEIGDEVILHTGVVVGTDGFGYVKDDKENKHIKFPQIGRVIIENNVEIGANSCIDKGALGDTVIGEGTKIDNLVQVAHNVKIGKRVVIAALTGISGSVIIEDDCIIAGQVGLADHTTIKKGAVIGAKSAVFPGKIVRKGVWCGIPVQPLDDYKRQNAYIRSLPRIKQEIKNLKKDK